jgi:hypothetical protein
MAVIPRSISEIGMPRRRGMGASMHGRRVAAAKPTVQITK